MEIPDNLVLERIKGGHAYFDIKSRESHYPYKEKRKYKLSHNVIHEFESYAFIVLTSNPDSCKKSVTLMINQSDWEDREDGFLNGMSCCDVSKCDIINKQDLLIKIKDRNNTFRRVARLANEKFSLVCSLCREAISKKFVSEETKSILEPCLDKAIFEIMHKLGID